MVRGALVIIHAFSPKRLGFLCLAILLVVLSWLGIALARADLTVRSFQRDSVPLLYIAPRWAKSIPGVLVAHGFAGSKQLMLSYGHVLAHGGYGVMLWDFDGHGANPTPLNWQGLLQNLEVAQQALVEQTEIDPNRLALLGHSMGSGIVMTAGIRAPDRFAATIAVSPTGANVTPQVPHNLQLQAGSWEGGFVANAERLLAQAGGANPDLAAGQGRELVVIPNVEHITILFSDRSHRAALEWLEQTFDRTVDHSSSTGNPQGYRDRRLGWYGLHLLGWLMGLAAFAPLLGEPESEGVRCTLIRQWAGLCMAPIVAITGLVLLSRWINLEDLGGVQVGGAIGLWLLLAGLTWLGVLARLPRPTLRMIGSGIVLFGVLWVAVGAMAQVVWLQWWLIPARLKLWLPLAIAALPWFLASGMVQQQIGMGQRMLWWLGQSLVLMSGLVLTLLFLPQLGFMFLLLPLFLPGIGVLSILAGLLNQAWVYAIGSALLSGWILAAAFPLSA
uniref:Serine aminopeptidase S33 domain-containing protein n=1 Tax=Cyanothece sp. (strain PCC 7425 / ATCC 29141) TaxID=395961 RepID=B8HVH3_CYAP4